MNTFLVAFVVNIPLILIAIQLYIGVKVLTPYAYEIEMMSPLIDWKKGKMNKGFSGMILEVLLWPYWLKKAKKYRKENKK